MWYYKSCLTFLCNWIFLSCLNERWIGWQQKCVRIILLSHLCMEICHKKSVMLLWQNFDLARPECSSPQMFGLGDWMFNRWVWPREKKPEIIRFKKFTWICPVNRMIGSIIFLILFSVFSHFGSFSMLLSPSTKLFTHLLSSNWFAVGFPGDKLWSSKQQRALYSSNWTIWPFREKGIFPCYARFDILYGVMLLDS